MQVSLPAQSPSVRKFIAQMEQPAKSSKVKPIGLLIADGREALTPPTVGTRRALAYVLCNPFRRIGSGQPGSPILRVEESPMEQQRSRTHPSGKVRFVVRFSYGHRSRQYTVFKSVLALVSVGSHSTAAVDFVANNPGLTLFHCHIQLHMDFGFMQLLEYSA